MLQAEWIKGMSQAPVFSVVITNHNYARFLKQAVQSALSQNYQSCEVIVVDDGSTDESTAVLDTFNPDECTVIFQEQAGQAVAMQRGFEASTGTYVLFLDADDYLYSDAISEVVESVASASVAKVQFMLDLVDREGREIGRFPGPGQNLPDGELLEHVFQNGSYLCPPCSANVYPRAVLEKLLPFPDTEKYRICADLYLQIRSLRYGPVRSIQKPLGAYRIHGENAFNITSIVETNVEILRKRYEVLENKYQLIEDEWKHLGRVVNENHNACWYGIFGLKDLMLCKKFAADHLSEHLPSMWWLIRSFVPMVLRNRQSRVIDKLKALLFVFAACMPSQLLRVVGSRLA